MVRCRHWFPGCGPNCARPASRELLVDQLGVDPSAQLEQIYLGISRGGGRDEEVSRVLKNLRATRLVTLTGPGEWARRGWRPRRQDGLTWRRALRPRGRQPRAMVRVLAASVG